MLDRKWVFSLCSLNHIQHFITLGVGVFSVAFRTVAAVVALRGWRRGIRSTLPRLQFYEADCACKSTETERNWSTPDEAVRGCLCVCGSWFWLLCLFRSFLQDSRFCVFRVSRHQNSLVGRLSASLSKTSFILRLLSSFTPFCPVPSLSCYFLSLFWNICS